MVPCKDFTINAASWLVERKQYRLYGCIPLTPMMLSLLHFFVPDLNLLTYHPFVCYIPSMFRQLLLAFLHMYVCLYAIKSNQINQIKYLSTKKIHVIISTQKACIERLTPSYAPLYDNLPTYSLHTLVLHQTCMVHFALLDCNHFCNSRLQKERNVIQKMHHMQQSKYSNAFFCWAS